MRHIYFMCYVLSLHTLHWETFLQTPVPVLQQGSEIRTPKSGQNPKTGLFRDPGISHISHSNTGHFGPDFEWPSQYRTYLSGIGMARNPDKFVRYWDGQPRPFYSKENIFFTIKRSSLGPSQYRTYLSGIGMARNPDIFVRYSNAMSGYGMPGPKLNRPSENRIRPDFGSPLYFKIDCVCKTFQFQLILKVTPLP